MYRITPKIYDINFSSEMTKFTDINQITGNASTTENLFEIVDNIFFNE